MRARKICRRGLHHFEGKRCLDCSRADARVRSRARREADPQADRDRCRAYAAENRDRLREYQRAWRAANVARLKQYELDRGARRRDADLRRLRAWVAANPDKHRAAVVAWAEENADRRRDTKSRRRAVERGIEAAPVTPAHLEMLLVAQAGRCRYCGTPLGRDRHLEHRVPLARGGIHAPWNLCFACPACNLSKGTKTETEFLSRRFVEDAA